MKYVLVLTSFLLAGRAFAGDAPVERFEYEEPHMGTKFRVVFYAPDKTAADKAARTVFERVAQLNRILSDYLPESELMQLCGKFAREAGPPVPVSEELFFVLSKAREVSELSDGAFDVTIGPVVKLWRVARKTGKLPPKEELETARKKVGWQKVLLDPKARTVRLSVPGMLLDFGGIAKGYAADEGLRMLEKAGFTRAMVAASGDIAVADSPPGAPGWKIEIGPLTRKSERKILLLRHAAVSTSGDAEQFVEIDGVRYSHIVDPRTGLGLVGRQSVTLIARRGITADSMTKMACILPAEKALERIEKLADTACLIRSIRGSEELEFQTRNFAKYLDTP